MKEFFRKVFCLDFFKKMLDAKDPTVSSSRWISLFAAITIILTACGLSIYCAIKVQPIPGGVEPLLIGLFFAAVLGKSYTSYIEAKKTNGNGNGTPKETTILVSSVTETKS